MAQANRSYTTPFEFENHDVRVVMDADCPWFVGKDVCNALGLSNHKQALSRLNIDERTNQNITDSMNRKQSVVAVNEPGIYRLVFTSRVDAAERFKRWLAHEVLPAIRKTGSYNQEKPVHVREHDRRTSTKLDDALKLKTNIDRLESVVASIQPAVQPNFCAMVIDGEHVFVDINRFDGRGRAVVIQHDGTMRIQHVEPDAHNLRTFGARSALGERYKSPHGGTMRNSVAIVGMVMEPQLDERRQGYVDDVTDRLKLQITTLLEAGPFTDIQIAKKLCCNPKLVKAVRKVQSRKPADRLPGMLIEHEPRPAPYRDRVIAMIRQGYGNAAIATQLGCSPETVRRHKVRMLAG
ncbi:BRO family protein [Rhizobium pusense]|uniref:BRO family protein n=1 Tax=Agrobacterium pusense TaxID=648995 RepID=UPI00244C6E84|nr:BRO family protein [Agrobacterium pusense]MDH2091148.1 BRO family protein [Agrobacterium pusense]